MLSRENQKVHPFRPTESDQPDEGWVASGWLGDRMRPTVGARRRNLKTERNFSIAVRRSNRNVPAGMLECRRVGGGRWTESRRCQRTHRKERRHRPDHVGPVRAGRRLIGVVEDVSDASVANCLPENACVIARETTAQSETCALGMLVDDTSFKSRVTLSERYLRVGFLCNVTQTPPRRVVVRQCVPFPPRGPGLPAMGR